MTLVSGASTVPSLSSAVVDALLPRFGVLEKIEHAISPGNRTSRRLWAWCRQAKQAACR